MWFDGFRVLDGGIYARPRYRCVHTGNCDASCGTRTYRGKPTLCDGTHRFSGAEQTRTSEHPDGHICLTCGHAPTDREGSAVAHAWDFEARLIADALIHVGEGNSYRDSAEAMRRSARRYRTGIGAPIPSRSGETVHRYLDHFGEVVLAAVEETEWPEVLVLDALPLRKREVLPDDPFSYEISGNGAVLTAYGYIGPFPRRRRGKRDAAGNLQPGRTHPQALPMAWKMATAGGVDRFSWFAFLSTLPGTPRWIVVDGDSAVRIAIAMRWGTGPGAPIVFSCEGHLQEKFRERARNEDHLAGAQVWDLWPEHKRSNPNPPPGPLWSRDDYRAFLDKILAYPPEKVVNITSSIKHHDRVIRHQFDLKDAFPYLPKGTGALEGGMVKVRDWLGDRTTRFQNVRRMNVMFGLMRANLGGKADAPLYTRIIRAELERTNGRPAVNWRQHLLAYGVVSGQQNPPGSLFQLSDDAKGTIESARRPYWVSAQASTMERKVAVLNDYHFVVGAPPIKLSTARTPGVVLTGRMLTDFPTFLDEWDPTNPEDPYAMRAGHYAEEVGWICADNPAHRWRAKISDRLIRLVGCGTCNRVRGIAAQNAGGKDPQLLRDALKATRDAWGDFDIPRRTLPPLPASSPMAFIATTATSAIFDDPDLPF